MAAVKAAKGTPAAALPVPSTGSMTRLTAEPTVEPARPPRTATLTPSGSTASRIAASTSSSRSGASVCRPHRHPPPRSARAPIVVGGGPAPRPCRQHGRQPSRAGWKVAGSVDGVIVLLTAPSPVSVTGGTPVGGIVGPAGADHPGVAAPAVDQDQVGDGADGEAAPVVEADHVGPGRSVTRATATGKRTDTVGGQGGRPRPGGRPAGSRRRRRRTARLAISSRAETFPEADVPRMTLGAPVDDGSCRRPSPPRPPIPDDGELGDGRAGLDRGGHRLGRVEIMGHQPEPSIPGQRWPRRSRLASPGRGDSCLGLVHDALATYSSTLRARRWPSGSM